MKRIVYISSILLIFVAKFSFSQSIQFSQFYSAPMVLAPSFAGAIEQSRAVANYRDQWSNTFTTFAASYDQYFPKIKSGMGFLALKDKAGSGDLGMLEVGFLYSWAGTITKKKGGWYVRPGIHFKMTQRTLDFSKLRFSDQFDADGTFEPTRQTNEAAPLPSKIYLDAASSLIVYGGDAFWGGFSVDHLFRPNESLYNFSNKVAMRTSIFAGYKIIVGQSKNRKQYSADQESVTFTALYRYQRPFDQLDIGAYWDHEPFTLGIWLRGLPVVSKYLEEKRLENMEAVVFLVGYKIFDLRIGYSYDMTISQMLGKTKGSHEISLMYEFNTNVKTKNKHATIPCPKF